MPLTVHHKQFIFISVMIVFLVFYTLYITASNSMVLKLRALEKDKLSEIVEIGQLSTQGYNSNEVTAIDTTLVTKNNWQGDGIDLTSTTKEFEIGPTFLDLEKTLCHDKFEHKNDGKPKKPCPINGIVSVYQGGRLANQIWEYAAMWAVSKETGLEAYAPRCVYNRILKVFKSLPYPSMEEISHCHVDMKNFTKAINGKEFNWNGTTQGIILQTCATEPLRVAKWQKYIPLEYPMRDELVEKNTKVLLEAQKKSSSNTFVGIHVRRTDYPSYIKRKYNGTAPEKDFFLKAMEYYETKYKNVTFVLASDDRKWCEENLGSKNNLFIAPPASPEQDIALMSMCNHSIFDFGTYGAWGPIYSGGDTVYYYVPKYTLPQNVAKILPTWRSV